MLFRSDIFAEKLEGLVLLEVEFPNEEEALAFELPKNSFKIVEVTEDERYKNHNLALYGNPKDIINLAKQFENAKQGNLSLSELSGFMNSYGAMRAIFYNLFYLFLHYYKLYMLNRKEEDLHQFRVTIRRTRSLLQCNKNLLEEQICRKFMYPVSLQASGTALTSATSSFSPTGQTSYREYR